MSKLNTILLFLLIVIPYGAFACACDNAALEQSIARTPLVAGIEVLKIDTVKVRVDSESLPIRPYAKYTVRVIENFKGLNAGDTILVYSSFSDCGYHFKAGLKYIVFAHLALFKDLEGEDKVAPKSFETTACNYNIIFNEARIRDVKNALRPGADKVLPIKLDE